MRLNRKALSSVIALGVLIAVPSPAGAAEDFEHSEPPAPYLVPTSPSPTMETGPLPDDVSDVSPLSADVAHALLRIEVEHPELNIIGSEWDPVTETVNLYSAAASQPVEAIIESYGATGRIVYQPSKFDPSTRLATMEAIIGDGGKLPSGHQISMVIPELDGSSIEVVLDESVQSRDAVQLPKVDIPITITYGSAPISATRNHSPTPERYSGAYMRGPTNGCSTGFRITEIATGTPAMASAHHCGKLPYDSWYYSSSASNYGMGQFQGGMHAGGDYYGDVAIWKGSGIGNFVPGIFVGDNTVAGSGVFAIRGAVAPTVGTNVCYSGSFSGTVCGNEITHTGIYVCYTDVSLCYGGITRTEQISGVPAAGQGDSGGPAYQPISPTGPFAAGIISGISNSSTSCTGDSGGRACSDIVLYAPVTEVFAVGYGLNYVP